MRQEYQQGEEAGELRTDVKYIKSSIDEIKKGLKCQGERIMTLEIFKARYTGYVAGAVAIGIFIGGAVITGINWGINIWKGLK